MKTKNRYLYPIKKSQLIITMYYIKGGHEYDFIIYTCKIAHIHWAKEGKSNAMTYFC